MTDETHLYNVHGPPTREDIVFTIILVLSLAISILLLVFAVAIFVQLL